MESSSASSTSSRRSSRSGSYLGFTSSRESIDSARSVSSAEFVRSEASTVSGASVDSNESTDSTDTEESYDDWRDIPRIPTPGFSFEETVLAISSFYDLLVHMYLPAEVVFYPPEDGWPEMTDECLVPMHKSDTVNELLRHLPYIRQGKREGEHHVYYRTFPIQYARLSPPDSSDSQKAFHISSKFDEGIHELPSHVFMLFDCWETAGHRVLLDTERGVIMQEDCEAGGLPTGLTLVYDDDTLDDGQTWRSFPAYGVADYFERLKKDFTRLKMFPMDERGDRMYQGVAGGGQGQSLEVQAAQEIYRSFGWPSADYDKRGCMQALKRLWYRNLDHAQRDEAEE